MQEKVNIFVSYAHEDSSLLKNLRNHLTPLKRLDGIGLWCDMDISAGVERQDIIETQLKNAQIILLLVSPYFIASEHCYSREMKRAVERHISGEARVIPVILRPILWHSAPFGKLQALPLHGKPVTNWRNRDDAFLNITEGVRKAVEEQLIFIQHTTNTSMPIIKQLEVKKKNTKKPRFSRFDVCLVCATFNEAKMLMNIISLQCNTHFEKALHRNKSDEYYYTTIQNHYGERFRIHVSWQSAYGHDQASLHLKAIIEEFNPRFVGMTGVCAGDKRKVKLGDLVIANCAFIYDDNTPLLQKKGRQQLQNDVHVYHSNIDEQYIVKALYKWKQAIKGLPRPNAAIQQNPPEGKTSLHNPDIPGPQSPDQENELPPTPYIIPMASVSSVRRDNPFAQMGNLIYQTVALDMEGASFYHTVAEFPGIHALVVKGVCDYADQDKNDVYHEYASKISATYMLCFLQEYFTSDRMHNPS